MAEVGKAGKSWGRWLWGKARKPRFRETLDALIVPGDTVNVLQIGANDGLINDPLHGFLRANPKQTQVILVEPQAELIPILTATYAFHPRHRIFAAAVGPVGHLTLYRLRKSCWPDLALDYGRNWPAYRAPSGITSGERGHVEAWVKTYYRGTVPVHEAVEAVEVESLPSSTLIERAGLFRRLDVLQVDVEGFDDHVIRQSDIPRWRPRVIHYERTHLGATREAAIAAELDALGYEVQPLGMNALARRRD